MEVTTRPARKVALELGLSKERVQKLDDAEAAALAPKAAPAAGEDAAPEPAITSAAAEARQKARKKKDAEEEAAALAAEKAKPTGLIDRAKKAIGIY